MAMRAVVLTLTGDCYDAVTNYELINVVIRYFK